MDNPGAAIQPAGAPAGSPQPSGNGAQGGEPGGEKAKVDLTIDSALLGGDKEKGGQPPKAPEGGKPPADPNKKIWKMNVYGKDVDFDATDESAVRKIVQKGLAADKKFMEAANVEKQLNGLVRALRENPEKVLLNERMGHNPEALAERILTALGPKARKAAEAYMSKVVDEELMDPKDREIMNQKRSIEEYENQKKLGEQEKQNERVTALKQHYTGEYEKDIVSVLQSSGLPKTPHTVKRMAYYLHQGLQRGIELKAADVVEYVQNDYRQETLDLYGATDGDALLSVLGDNLTNKIVAAATQKAKNGQLKPLGAKEQPKGGFEPAKKSKYITGDQWREKHG